MAFDPQTLINQETGEFDRLVISRQAVVRAQHTWGDCAPPVSVVRSELLNLEAMAHGLRAEWRRARGLPSDLECVMVAPFGRQVEGVRASRF